MATAAQQAIRDFLKAVDSGWLGQMPAGFNASAFVVALRSAVQEPPTPLGEQLRAALRDPTVSLDQIREMVSTAPGA